MPDTAPTVGDKAPDFDLPRDGGETVALSAYLGKRVVLFFYPRDDTPGCTNEAIGFTAALPDFQALDAEVLGISKDSVKSHGKFAEKHRLGVPLLSDEQGDTCERYGTWVEKNLYGRTHMGIERSTFVIGPDGVLTHVWRKVRVPGHVEAVLETLRGD